MMQLDDDDIHGRLLKLELAVVAHGPIDRQGYEETLVSKARKLALHMLEHYEGFATEFLPHLQADIEAMAHTDPKVRAYLDDIAVCERRQGLKVVK